jgi:hypothetical protein
VSFKIGDVCEFHGLHSRCLEFNGSECVILEGLAVRYGYSTHKERECYKIRAALDGAEWLVEPQYLRLRKPPKEPIADFTPGEWELCPFNPYKQRVRVT